MSFAAKKKTSCEGYKQKRATDDIIIAKRMIRRWKVRRFPISKHHAVFGTSIEANLFNGPKLELD